MDLYIKAEAASGIEWQYNKNRPQNFAPIGFTGTTNSVGANIIRFFPIVIREDLEIIDVGISITAGAAGNMVVGLYDGIDGIPNNLLFQSTVFDTSVTGIQTYTLPSPYSIKKGVYFKCVNSNANPTLNTIPSAAHDNVFGCNSNNGTIMTEGRYNYTYTGTLPVTAGGITNRFVVNSIELIFTIS